MKSFLVLITALTAASASVVQLSPALYTAAIPITTQYHAQDGLGQYSYGYSGGPSAKAEYKSLDGVTRGSYSYVDADGELQTVQYTADSENGFQASATNLPKAPIDDKVPPKPVEDTPEVAMARAEHLAAVREAELKAAEDPSGDDDNGNDSSNGHAQQQQQQNESQEAQAALSQESMSAETESPNGSSERSSQESEINGNGDAKGNGNGNGNGSGNGNGNNGITQLVSNGLSSALGLSGISNSIISNSLSNGLSSINLSGLNGGLTSGISDLSAINLGSIIPSSGLSGLSSLQVNKDLASIGDEFRFSEITPATTTQLRRPVEVAVPATSYLRVSTPTHGYSIVSPTVLTAVPTLGATSSQAISRTLPISLSPKLFL